MNQMIVCHGRMKTKGDEGEQKIELKTRQFLPFSFPRGKETKNKSASQKKFTNRTGGKEGIRGWAGGTRAEMAYLIALRLVLSLPATGGTHGGTPNIAGGGMRCLDCRRAVGARTGDVGLRSVLKVGQPASTDSLVAGGSPISTCRRHVTELENGRGGGGIQWTNEGRRRGEDRVHRGQRAGKG